MSGDWPEIRLKDLSEVITKGTTPTTLGFEFTTSGVNFVKAEAVTVDGRIDKSKLAFIDISANEKLRRSKLKGGDVLFSMAGMVIGKTCVFPKELEPANTNQALGIIRVHQDKIDPWFLHYYIKNPVFNQFINNLVGQSAQPNLNLAEIGNLPIRLPSIVIQHAITHILKTLDDKIELNRKMNETLESMARALFKSWFIDFDPVRAKMDGRWKKGQSLPGLPADLWDLFPDNLVKEPAGTIPKGWAFSSLYASARFVNGASFKATDFNSERNGRPVVKIAELKSGIDAQTKWSSRELGLDQTIQSRDLLYSWSGSPETSLEAFLWIGPQGLLNQHIFKVVTENEAQKAFVFYLLKELRGVLVEIAKNKQTTGLGHVTVQDMKQIYIAMPPPETLQRFCAPLLHFFSRYISNLEVAKSLGALRDSLLPKLVSGEIQISDSSSFLRERGL